MRTTVSCSWCLAGVELMPGGGATYCPECHHRADVCRLDCDCAKCRRPPTTGEILDALDFGKTAEQHLR
jgi:hypothetical protein